MKRFVLRMLAFTGAMLALPAMPACADANVAALGIVSRDVATITVSRHQDRDQVRVAVRLLNKSAPSIADQNGKKAPPSVLLEPSPAGPIVIPDRNAPDRGPPRTLPPKPKPQPPSTCIGKVCPIPVPYPNN